MKKFVFILSIILTSAMISNARIKTITDGNFVFEADDIKGTATLLRLVDNNIPELELPRVAHEGSTMFLVNELGNDALKGCSNIKSLIITDNITSIYKDAFIGCTSLTELEFQRGPNNFVILSLWEGDSE